MAKAKKDPLGNSKGKDPKMISAMQAEAARFSAQAKAEKKQDKEKAMYDHA